MNCPRCQTFFEAPSWDRCPICGETNPIGVTAVMKTSTIMISAGGGGIYRSIEEVPEALRKALVRSTNGLNSATILIADQGGRERITKALRNLDLREKPVAAPPRQRSRLLPFPWLWFAGAAVTGLTGWLLWLRLL